jgi:hypothetical protein
MVRWREAVLTGWAGRRRAGGGVGRWKMCIRRDGGGDFRGDFYFSILFLFFRE